MRLGRCRASPAIAVMQYTARKKGDRRKKGEESDYGITKGAMQSRSDNLGEATLPPDRVERQLSDLPRCKERCSHSGVGAGEAKKRERSAMPLVHIVVARAVPKCSGTSSAIRCTHQRA